MPGQLHLEFKRSLIKAVKEHVEVWDTTNRYSSVAKESAWDDIQKTLNFSKRRLQNLWTSFRKHYYNTLMNKTMQRDNKLPKWKLFHDLSFLYEDVKEKIEEKMGGISPPLLKPDPKEIASQKVSCPCCIPTKTNKKLDLGEMSRNDLQTPIQLLEAKNTSQLDKSSALSTLPQDGSAGPLNKSQTSQPMKRRKNPWHTLTLQDRAIERQKIIESIKAYPALYAKDMPGPKCSPTYAWKKVAEQVGLPLVTIQNRWRFLKGRYVDELMRERYAKGPFHSTWPNFKHMSYMRKYVKADVEALERVRQEMQQIVKEHKSRQTIDLCTDEDDTYLIVNGNTSHALSIDKPKVISDLGNNETSIPNVQSNLSPQPAMSPNSDDASQPLSVISLDLSSDEEDHIIYLDDFESMENDNSMEVYEEEIVYFAEPLQDDIICLDDDDANDAIN